MILCVCELHMVCRNWASGKRCVEWLNCFLTSFLIRCQLLGCLPVCKRAVDFSPLDFEDEHGLSSLVQAGFSGMVVAPVRYGYYAC